MNEIRLIVGNIFDAPMERMSYISYFSYVNNAGKVTARSLMEVCIALLEYAEEQEKKNEKYEGNFKEIEAILQKLVDKKVNKVGWDEDEKGNIKINHIGGVQIDGENLFICNTCGKQVKTKLALAGHKRSHKAPTAVV